MHYQRILRAVATVAAVAWLSGCATTVQMNYRTQPGGAQLYSDGRYLGTGGGSVGVRLSKDRWNAGQHCVVLPPVEAHWVSGAQVQAPPRRVCLQSFTGGVVYRDALIVRPADVPGLRADLDYADQLAQQRLAERQVRAAEAAAAAAARQRALEIRLHEHDRHAQDRDRNDRERNDRDRNDRERNDRERNDRERNDRDRNDRDRNDRDRNDRDRNDRRGAKPSPHGSVNERREPAPAGRPEPAKSAPKHKAGDKRRSGDNKPAKSDKPPAKSDTSRAEKHEHRPLPAYKRLQREKLEREDREH